jgi:cytochrome d ubiquinol oxidase subunit I
MDAEFLHRAQFGFTLTFHYIYPPLSIGLSVALILFEAIYLKTKDPIWEQITKFWIRVFALTFALGVATGIPLVFALGTNWARYSRFVGDVMGSSLAAEGLFAFAMEAGFLGILLFGWDKVSRRMHFLATIIVSMGAHFSGIWITCANSWMQTPAGYEIKTAPNGETYAVVTDWWEMLLNHSSLSHLSHVMIAAWLTGAFIIISVSSYYLLKKKYSQFAIRSIKVALVMASVCVVAHLISGDHLAKLIARFNPVKFAAFEGVFKTEEYTKMYLFGVVDTEKQTVHGVALPGMLSFLIHRDFQKAVDGLDQAPRDEWPKVHLVFQMYHLMVAMWALMFICCLIGLWMWKKNAWTSHPKLLRLFIVSVAFPQIGNIAGWYATEFGRQPWTVYKLLKTKDAYSGGVTVQEALISFSLFAVIYLTFFVLFLVLLDRKIKHGPTEAEEEAPYRDPFKVI